MANVDDILEQCVEQVVSGRSTVDDCLTDYPQYADILRPLLRTALEIDELDRPKASRVAFQAGKRLMTDAVARRERDRATSRVAVPKFIRRFVASLKPMGAGVTWRRLVLVGGLGAATLLVWLGAAGLLLRAWNSALMPEACVVADASGIAQVQTNPGATWQPLATGWVLGSGHRVRTGNPGSVTVSFFDGSTSWLGPDSELVVAQVGARRDGSGKLIVVEQVAGTTYNRVQSQAESPLLFQIETPSASVMVHGTEFKVGVNPDNSTSVVVIEGEVAVTGEQVTVMLTDGQATTVEAHQTPGAVVLAPSEELVEGPSAGEPSPQLQETQASVEPSAPAGTAEPAASASEPAPTGTTASSTPVRESPEAPLVTETPTSTSEAILDATPTATPRPPTPTVAPEPPTPTVTPKPPTSTSTPKPAPPSPTVAPSPSPGPTEVVEVFQASYKASKGELRVRARTNVPGCTLTLVGFGPMVPEGDHWSYVQEALHQDDVPSAVTVQSSCGGSGTSPVQRE